MAAPRIIPRAGHPISRGYIDPDALRILYRLHRAGYHGFLVGGSVRDLMTGRTHQIRVHLASIGHPIAGDPVYATGVARSGPPGLNRLFLHSWRLEFASVSGDRIIRAEAPLPPELETVLDDLRAERQ